MESKYNTTWVKDENSLPPEGVKCIKCEADTLRRSKPEWGGGLYCPSCKWKWKVSKFQDTPKQTGNDTEKVLQAIANLRTYEREVAIALEGQIKSAKKEIIEKIDKGGIIYPNKKEL